jgi:uncharacterized membrane protein
MGNNGRVGKFSPEQLAQCLGWFSIGLGLAQLLAPRQLSKVIGLQRENRYLLRLLGLREVASGIGILTQRRPANWVWSRVGGDALDLALLGVALNTGNPQRGRVAAATAAVAGVTALDVLCGQELTRSRKPSGDGAVHVERSVTINLPPEAVYAFWRDFKNLPRFMGHLQSVETTGPTTSHWVAKGPAGTNVEWDAEIITDTPKQVISWRSLEGADVANAGAVRFEEAPGGRGTVVRVKMQYRSMGGTVGSTVAKLLGQAPEKQLKVDLYQLKQYLETGEVARTEGQPAGRARSLSTKYDAALQK